MDFHQDENGFFVIKNSDGSIHQRMNANRFLESMKSSGDQFQF